jgi:uncharacterized protein (DUF433 family)
MLTVGMTRMCVRERKMEVIGKGVYNISEASRLTRLRPQRVREWFRGRESASRIIEPAFESDYPVCEGEYAISFLDLIELNIGGKLREANVPLPHIRKVYDQLRREYGDHPFCRRAIYVGDQKIFTRGLNAAESSSVIEAITNQCYFDNMILPFLQRIDYDQGTQQAIRWHIADGVVIDPKIRFGSPVVEGVGISTSILRDSYFANGEDAASVARWFGIEERHVMAAVDFGNDLAA